MMDINSLIEPLEGLYTLPEVCGQLERILEEDGVEGELAELISYDPVLSARLFQYAAEMQPESPANSVSEAVERLGVGALQELLGSTSSRELFSRVPPDIVDMHDFWHHSVCCALAAEVLARRIDYLFPEKMFLSGLLHDIGQLVIYQALPEQAVQVLRQAGSQESHRYRMEQQILTLTHADVGAELLRRWGLPKEVHRAALFHHEPRLAGAFELQASIVHIATAIANCVEPSWKAGEGACDALPQISRSAWDVTGLTPEVVDETVSDISIQSLDVLRIVDPSAAMIF